MPHSWVACRRERGRPLHPLSFARMRMMQSTVVPEKRPKWGCKRPEKPRHPPCSPPHCAVAIRSRVSQPMPGCMAGT